MSNTDPTGPMVAAVDVGSNSIKMTVGRPTNDGAIDEVAIASDTVRLGAGLDQTGRLADDRIEAALTTLTRFAADARALGAVRLIGVATEATRIATNGATFLDRVRRETGWELHSISGDEEARLTFRGLATTTDLAGPLVVADIGGGSTELIAASDGEIRFSQSLPLGSGRLTDRLIVADPPTSAELAACRSAAAERLPKVIDLGGDKGSPVRLIAVGGTGEYLGRLLGATAFQVEAVDRALAEVMEIRSTELAVRLAIQPARARVLPAGIAIVRAVAELVGASKIEVARSGIRTGLLLAAFDEAPSWSPATEGAGARR